MLRIRLRRVGGKKQPSYRIVVAESTAPRDGKFVEIVGFHNPRTEPETIQVKEERVLYWLSVGAQPSDAVARLLKRTGTMARFERMKGGESLEALVEEAAAVAAEATPVPEEAAAVVAEATPVLEEATAVEQTISPETDDPNLTSTTQDEEPVAEGDDSE